MIQRAMSNVMVYRFRFYNNSTGMMKRSRRWASRHAIENPGIAGGSAQGVVVPGSGTEVDSMTLDSDGMTAIGFGPVFNRSAEG